MMIENNVLLSSKTTFGLGGKCREFVIPESVPEAIDALKTYPNAPLLAGGSNLVINDLHEFDSVISLLKFNTDIHPVQDGIYYVGASVRNHVLIRKINDAGYGGMEYLYYVPGTIGGAIYMNAGTGKKLGNDISQHILSVDWYNGEQIVTMSKEECDFGYRHSFFQENKGLIIGAKMVFDPQSIEKSKELIQARHDRVNRLQDHSGKTCGTLCKVSNRGIMRWIRLIHYGKKDGVHYSSKTPNWLINSGNGNFTQFRKCILVAERLHKLFGRDFELEIEVWE